MGILKKIKTDAAIVTHALFRGMAAADDVISSQTDGSDGNEVIRQVHTGGGVFQDMLQGEETQRVIEMRDKYYRVLKEADKYDASQIKMVEGTYIDEETGEKKEGVTFILGEGSIRKKTLADFLKHNPVYGENEIPARTIQDNKHIVSHNGILGIKEEMPDDYFGQGLYDYQTTLTVERNGFVPRIEIDKFVTKMVVRQNQGEERAKVDFYLPTIAGQFTKIDAILIANINQMWQTKNYRSDLTEFSSIEWYSDKAWNSDDVCLFKYDDIHLENINVFDGSFVLTFDCHIVSDGKYLAEKYETEELTKKYKEEAPKHNSVDIFAAQRRAEKDKKDVNIENLGSTTIKLS